MDIRWLVCSLLATFIVPVAGGQAADWRSVENIPLGTRIHIKLQKGRIFGHCKFSGATEDDLTCDFKVLGPRTYLRANIRAIFSVHNARAIGFGTGFALGAVDGLASPHAGISHASSALLDGAILGCLGLGLGAVADPWFHGKVIYQTDPTKKLLSAPLQPVMRR